jgi:hypothetical protein
MLKTEMELTALYIKLAFLEVLCNRKITVHTKTRVKAGTGTFIFLFPYSLILQNKA